MNRKNITIAVIAATLSLGATASFAAENGNNYPDIAPQGQQALTRAEVKAQLADARAQGLLPTNDENYPVLVASGPSKTRAEVKQELAQARSEGLIATNDVDYPVVASNAPSKSRDEVKQELAKARASGELNEFQGS